MAQVKIFGLKRTLLPVREALSEAIHASLMEAFDYPAEKRFHRFIPMEDGDFLFPADRTERYTILEFSIFEGRSVAARKALIRLLFEKIPAATGITPQDLEITIFETPRHNWGIHGLPGDEIGLNYKVEV